MTSSPAGASPWQRPTRDAPAPRRGSRAAPAQQPRPRRWRWVVLSLVLILLIAGATYLVWKVIPHVSQLVKSEGCTLTNTEGEVDLSLEQAANATTITAVGTRLGLTERGVAIGLETAMQESKLVNINYGDRDSLGLFQQRPSMDWGTPQQIMDPVYASEKFFEALAKVDNYDTLPMHEAAQKVQRSADGSFYAQHESEALIMAAVLTGRVKRGLSCYVKQDALAEQKLGGNGLTPRANAVRTQLSKVFGELPLGGYQPGGVRSGHMKGSAHYDGRAIDIFFRPISAANTRRGWEVANWLVAHAKDLGITTVIFDDAIWTTAASDDGWADYTPPSTGSGSDEAKAATASPTAATQAILRHLDHVHVEVGG